jgi:hypothetical protein
MDGGLSLGALCGKLLAVMQKAGGMGGLTPAQQMSFKCFIACKKAATKAGLVAVARDKDAK